MDATIDDIEVLTNAIKDFGRGRFAFLRCGFRTMGKCRYLIGCPSFLNIASALLKHDGNVVAKTFQGAYYNQFYTSLKEKFRYARAYSPAASRKKSAEVYVVGKGYISQNYSYASTSISPNEEIIGNKKGDKA